ncbi:carboxylesterase [Candidatus Bathyarchaeota archaeon]|jgi:phospholipase/carboxylesterase|nr:carboxylesterase [Candidatus Bathyarchaeota archaeon]|tara:strand:- start:377 stop:1048 length:672 start_codon:yes stop_codon:yes gene_type:complete
MLINPSDAVELNPTASITASVIWLHGLGADGHDFESIVPELGVAEKCGVRFVFPHAPHMPVTINGGMVMRAWYDIVDPDIVHGEDSVGIRNAAATVHTLVRREIEDGRDSRRIVLAGFSQGGAIVLHAGLRYPERLGGILALSTYLPLRNDLEGEAHPSNADVPIFMAHGTDDPIVPLARAQQSRAVLEDKGYFVEWHNYPMQHAVCMPEIQHVGVWLRTVFA